MRTYPEAMATSRDEPAFSNSSMWELWAPRWCYRCTKDSPEMVDRGAGCPLIMVALMGRTPVEWTAATERDRIFGNYQCSEFEERPADDEEPQPEPGPGPFVEEMPEQTDIFTFFAEEVVDGLTVQPEQVPA